MDRERRRVGSVKAAIDLYGERIIEGNSAIKKPQTQFPETNSRTRELNPARSDMCPFIESRKVVNSLKDPEESELLNAKTKIRELEKLNTENYKYGEVITELGNVNQELIKLNLDMSTVLEEKRQAEKKTRASSTKISSCSSTVEELRKEIEEVNEEHVLVELARIEALKEFAAIEAQRKETANQYSSAMGKTQKKMNGVIQEIDHAKELKIKLGITNYGIDVLQSELNLAKDKSTRKGDESDSSLLLKSIIEDLEGKKKELESIREEGFEIMATMDIIRDELKRVSEEKTRLKNTEKEDLTVRELKTKLVRGKSKLEAVSEAGTKAISIVSNLSISLKQVKSEAEAAKEEREIISKETETINAEVKKTESERDSAEERLKAAMQELEAVESSEAKALENLKLLTVNTMRARASTSKHNSTMRISIFEYEYLKGRALGAEEIADKKIEAAQAWIEALKASEKEILMKTEIGNREIKEGESCITERSLSGKSAVEGELKNRRQKRQKNREEAKNLDPEVTLPRKFTNRSGNSTPRRQAKLRKPVSPAGQLPRQISITIRRRRSVMPNLGKFFSGKRKSASPAQQLSRQTSFTVRRRTKVMPNLGKFFSGKRIERDL